MSRRVVANLVVFGLLTAVLTAWALRSFVGFQDPATFEVEAVFEAAPGLRPDDEVAYLGTSVGSITDVELRPGQVVVSMAVRADAGVPAAVRADIRRRSAVGEPYVFLRPRGEADLSTPLEGGTRIPLADTSTSLSYAVMFDALDQLFSSVPPQDLDTLVGELATAVDGRGEDLRAILRDTEAITDTFASAAPELDAAFDEITELTRVLADNAEPLSASLDDLRALTDTLGAVRADLDTVLDGERTVLARTHRLLADSEQSLGCTLTALAVVTSGLDEPSLAALESGIDDAPELLEILDEVLVEHDEQTWIRLLAQGDDEMEIEPHDEPLALPEVPPVPVCDAATTPPRPPVGPAAVTPAGSGDGGTLPGGDEAVAPSDREDAADAAPPASSEEFTEESSVPVLEIAAGVLAALVLGVVGWVLVTRRRSG